MVLLESESGEGAREVPPGSAEAGRLCLFLIAEEYSMETATRIQAANLKNCKLNDHSIVPT
jgi:hypothetical protein